MLTGKGNIKDSRENAIEIVEKVVAAYLGVGDQPADSPARESDDITALADQAAEAPPMSVDAMRQLAARIEARHQAIGYSDYASWIDSHGA